MVLSSYRGNIGEKRLGCSKIHFFGKKDTRWRGGVATLYWGKILLIGLDSWEKPDSLGECRKRT